MLVEAERRRAVRWYIARVSVAALALFALIAVTLFARDFTHKLERQARAGCARDLQLANLPKLTRYPSAPLVDIATTSRKAYIEAGCPGYVDSETGRPFPVAPPTFTAVPPPTPRDSTG
jgi:hypothetical protein